LSLRIALAFSLTSSRIGAPKPLQQKRALPQNTHPNTKHQPENPKTSVPSPKNPKTTSKTPVNHTKKAYQQEAKE